MKMSIQNKNLKMPRHSCCALPEDISDSWYLCAKNKCEKDSEIKHDFCYSLRYNSRNEGSNFAEEFLNPHRLPIFFLLMER